VIALHRHYREYVWPYRRALGLGAAMTLLAVGFSLAQPLPMRYIFDDILLADRHVLFGGTYHRLRFGILKLVAHRCSLGSPSASV